MAWIHVPTVHMTKPDGSVTHGLAPATAWSRKRRERFGRLTDCYLTDCEPCRTLVLNWLATSPDVIADLTINAHEEDR